MKKKKKKNMIIEACKADHCEELLLFFFSPKKNFPDFVISFCYEVFIEIKLSFLEENHSWFW